MAPTGHLLHRSPVAVIAVVFSLRILPATATDPVEYRSEWSPVISSGLLTNPEDSLAVHIIFLRALQLYSESENGRIIGDYVITTAYMRLGYLASVDRIVVDYCFFVFIECWSEANRLPVKGVLRLVVRTAAHEATRLLGSLLGPYTTKLYHEFCKNTIKALCNADISAEVFIRRNGVSLPKTNIRMPQKPLRDIGGKLVSLRPFLAFFAANARASRAELGPSYSIIGAGKTKRSMAPTGHLLRPPVVVVAVISVVLSLQILPATATSNPVVYTAWWPVILPDLLTDRGQRLVAQGVCLRALWLYRESENSRMLGDFLIDTAEMRLGYVLSRMLVEYYLKIFIMDFHGDSPRVVALHLVVRMAADEAPRLLRSWMTPV
ncbi:hypothetical protein AXF42_Ash004883 [Apostasia shenzhenica]|uniref:Uncharacterized protein n=1 Tax=Apostasia shenzhenica TaxID=1088818 RepID=A0A2I0B7U5_9ASPA|nr:hypothetical protein AXF42_Ash004883 [Apostasia shenzhenica]